MQNEYFFYLKTSIYVCVYAYMCIYIYIYMFICIYICLFVYICVYLYIILYFEYILIIITPNSQITSHLFTVFTSLLRTHIYLLYYKNVLFYVSFYLLSNF